MWYACTEQAPVIGEPNIIDQRCPRPGMQIVKEQGHALNVFACVSVAMSLVLKIMLLMMTTMTIKTKTMRTYPLHLDGVA